MTHDLSESEALRYDRQIRVWGAEAQNKIQKSNILVCGISKLHIEIIKNIVLTGMNVTIQSSRNVTYDDLAYNFFVNENDINKPLTTSSINKIQELNSYAKVTIENNSIDNLSDSFFESFNVILVTECSELQALRINEICRSNHKLMNSSQQQQQRIIFFWSDVFGDEGIFYSDFGQQFQYKEDKQPGSTNNNNTTNATTTTEQNNTTNVGLQDVKTMDFISLLSILSKKWNEIPSKHFPLSKTFIKHRILTYFRNSYQRDPIFDSIDDVKILQQILLTKQVENDINTIDIVGNTNQNEDLNLFLSLDELKQLCNTCGSVSILACSILGSFLSQEIVKAVSSTGIPAYNVFIFDSHGFVAKAFPV